MLEWLENWFSSARLARMAILLVSHDRIFLDRSMNGILELDANNHQLRPYPGNYFDYLEQKLSERDRNWQIKLDFGNAPPSSRAVLHLENVNIGFGYKPV
jgi:ATPase subunit of ABC transporter with duplicated ATPase domains